MIRAIDPPAIPADSVPWLSLDQMIEVDRPMIEEMQIALIQRIENPGRNLAMVRGGGSAQMRAPAG